LDVKGELLDDVINEVDRVPPRVAFVDLQRPNPGRIVDDGIRVALNLLASGILESQEFHVELDVMARDPFVLSLGVDLASADVAWQALHSIADQRSIDAGSRDTDTVIALQIPLDPLRSEVVLAPQMEDLLDDLIRWSAPQELDTRFVSFRVD